MADKMVGQLRVDLTKTLPMMGEGDRLVIEVVGATMTTTIYDEFVPDFTGVTGTVSINTFLNYLAPTIVSLTASTGGAPILPSTTSVITCVATDPSNLPLSFAWEASGGTGATGTDDHITWEAPAAIGQFNIKCTATNSALAFSTANLVMNVFGVPTIVSLTPDVVQVPRGGQVNITCVATDPYTGDLYFQWLSTSGLIAGNTNVGVWTAPNFTGTYTISCLVSETSKGPQAASSVDIEVI